MDYKPKFYAEIPIVVSRMQDHEQVKPVILNLLEKLPLESMPFVEGEDFISKTDWLLSEEKRDYLEYVKPKIINSVSVKFKEFNPKGLAFGNFWFQQYLKNDVHEWHIHRNCHWTNVYFLELPINDLKTEIQNFYRTDIIKYEAEEGDIISFPACLYHRSPKNYSDGRKTVISFNTNYI